MISVNSFLPTDNLQTLKDDAGIIKRSSTNPIKEDTTDQYSEQLESEPHPIIRPADGEGSVADSFANHEIKSLDNSEIIVETKTEVKDIIVENELKEEPVTKVEYKEEENKPFSGNYESKYGKFDYKPGSYSYSYGNNSASYGKNIN